MTNLESQDTAQTARRYDAELQHMKQQLQQERHKLETQLLQEKRSREAAEQQLLVAQAQQVSAGLLLQQREHQQPLLSRVHLTSLYMVLGNNVVLQQLFLTSQGCRQCEHRSFACVANEYTCLCFRQACSWNSFPAALFAIQPKALPTACEWYQKQVTL